MKNFFQSLIAEIKTSVFPRNLFFYGSFTYLLLFHIPKLLNIKHMITTEKFILYSTHIAPLLGITCFTFVLFEVFYQFYQKEEKHTELLRKIFLTMFLIISLYQYITSTLAGDLFFTSWFFLLSLFSFILLYQKINLRWINRAIFLVSVICIISLTNNERYISLNASNYFFNIHHILTRKEILPESVIMRPGSYFISSPDLDISSDTGISKPFTIDAPRPYLFFGNPEDFSYTKISNNEVHVCIIGNTFFLPLKNTKQKHCIVVKRYPIRYTNEYNEGGFNKSEKLFLPFLTLLSHD